MTRKSAYRNFMFVGLLLLGCATLGLAQDNAGQNAPDNTKMNQGDQNPNQTTADQQQNNRSDLDITQPDSKGD